MGTLDVSGLMDGTPQRVLLEWAEYHKLEPWGEERADMRAAIVAATIYNMQRPRGSPIKRIQDFMAVPPSKADTTAAARAGIMAALTPLARPRDADPD